ncbi:aspartate 1-decarboxylase [Staphylococcus kloosii]|jgi:aspartate 1-decarboxylase|uniref:Aspartate 1-decarboxylase n=1 Tax=Staphylococcus kloosii TaxID=29384 RepID=A0ABQ0XTE5_9STAP|nr:aspartate 1-decarboxylase [Staphylococcus kloosii]AVQ35163.1 aspartate 1-decarboxylase [Staphylococcus kloosii]MBF7030373.1 aspartate 1-decarboxylase [Staphylococcus kloosii]PNZ03151.1 aspartate 1-decarboxylase [Staphylococcus kloosii]PTJ76234.1 aspartate 1-decarboxylase [Staphylococcus kloosii]SUM48205.1 aspartate 1-decarboxylase [Staphylococcus kloosii]
MIRTMMNAKIHRARVTESNLNYVGSITIDKDILEAVDILPNEKVAIVNNNNGARFETYVIEGERGSGKICLNGAASRLVEVDDVLIIMTYVQLNEEELSNHTPKVAVMDEHNAITQMIHERENEIVL